MNHRGYIGAAGAASAGASFARCSRSFVTPRYGVLAALLYALCIRSAVQAERTREASC
jgi:hypothetical protein